MRKKLALKWKWFYYSEYKLIHFMIPAIALLIMLMLLFNENLLPSFEMKAVALGVILYPFFDMTVYEYKRTYRLKAGLIAAVICALCYTFGSFIGQFGVVAVVLGLLVPVGLVIFSAELPAKLKGNGVFCSRLLTMGIGSTTILHNTLRMGLFLFIGMAIMAGIYFVYYSIWARKIKRKEGVWHPHPHVLKKHFLNMNPRLFRYASGLYLTAVIAYLIAVYLSHLFPQWIEARHTYWAPFFVFSMLQFNPNKKHSYNRVFHRFLGTFMGMLIALAVVYGIHNVIVLNCVYILYTLCFLGIAFNPKQYIHFATASNAFVMMMYVVVMKVPMQVIYFRMLETVIAVVMCIVCLLVFWPLLHAVMPLKDKHGELLK